MIIIDRVMFVLLVVKRLILKYYFIKQYFKTFWLILNICKICSLYSKYRRGQKYIQIDKERTLQAREKTNKSGYTCTSI